MRKYAAMGLTAVLAAASFPAAVLADEADVKSVRIGAPYDPVTMDYAELNVDPATYIDTLISDTLIRSKQGEYIGGAAESWETSEDGKTWTFKLKEGLTYSDGETPITSEDFVYAAKRLMDPEAGHYNAESGYILENGEEYYAGECEWDEVGIKAVDDLTIEYTFKNPQYESTFTSTSLFAPLEESFVDSLGTEYGSSADKILTNGPFIVSDWVSDSTMTLVKNENYWDGEVPLDKVTLKCVDDQTTRSMALQTGEIDIAYNLKTENLVEFEGNDNYDIQELQSLRSTYAFMNQNEDHALSDKALRQALLRGLDKETYCNTLLEGGATAGKAPVPPTLDFGFDDLKDENSYDPDSAKKILDEAGYKDVDGDGFVETPDGDPLVLDFVIYTSRAELGVYAQAAQASLKEIGINVNLNTVSYETLLDMRDSGQYDLLIWNVLVANTGDPENYLRENWYSSSANNTAGYNNPEVDKLLDELAQTFDEDKRKDLIIDIQQDIMDDAATVFFGYETTYLFSNKKVTGVKMYPMDYYWLTKDITLAE